jgi:hypothetical protein
MIRTKHAHSACTVAALVACSPALAAIVINPGTHAFVDVSTTGTSVGAISDDSEFTVVGASLTAAGFTGNELLPGGRSIRVGNNGGIIWGNSATDAFTNATEVGYANCNAANPGAPNIATMTAVNTANEGNGGLGPRQMLCPFWDDNFPITTQNPSCKWQVIAGDLIVQWTNEGHYTNTAAGVITYEVIVHSGVTIASGAPLVEFVYQDTFFGAGRYQNDGGSAAIGYKNWGIIASANDVEFGTSGGSGEGTTDPAYGDPSMHPKVAGYVESENAQLPHALAISGVVLCDSADFNCDGDTATDADIEAFFLCVAGTCPAPPCMNSADFNHDGDSATDADIEAFFRVLAGGTC